MNIEVGKLFVNKTFRFLLPVLKYYGIEFIQNFNNIFKVAFGIFDMTMKDIYSGHYIYCLIDLEYKSYQTIKTIEWLQEHESYVYDYSYPVQDKIYHMLILKVPQRFNKTYESFLNSTYSEMYNEEEVEELFPEITKGIEKKILKKYPEMKNFLLEEIKKEFNIVIDSNNFPEYELPLKNKEEIFNYKGGNVFFNPESDRIF